ncbi:DNA mismatch repair protein mutS [Bacteroidales bacterium Barb6]|nr:DNA mismatch repair protein mutS [Bacteroidales bacterium Barb6]
MKKVYAYYKGNVEAYSRCAGELRKRIHLLGTVRLVLAVAGAVFFWLFREESWLMLAGTIALPALAFILLMVYHGRLFTQKVYTEALISLNRNELKGLDYDFGAFDGAADKGSAEHPFSLDLDVFGEHSLFQSINRTVTGQGRELLADWFLYPLCNKAEIEQRQEAVKELAEYSRLRQHFHVTGSVRKGNRDDGHFLTSLTGGRAYYANSILWKVLLYAVPLVWAVILIGFAAGLVSGTVAGVYFGVSFLIANWRAKPINDLYNRVDKMEKIFSVYSDLMRSIEGERFQAGELVRISRQLTGSSGMTASRAVKQLSRHIGALDQRFSLAGILLNIFCLRDTRQALLLERWREAHREDAVRWLDALGEFDALASLGGFAFNHPDYVFPDIAASYFRMEGKDLGHPLLHRDVCVRNDMEIRKSPYFLIVTGANMAGKSTYLRTAGVNYLLACIGAPVFASSLTVSPARLITGLRTSDSLTGNESYFFAELKRLKMIIDRLKQGEELFIILDEILKGTNSVDKQKGSLALMRQLAACNTCGIIATHDLVLGTLADNFPEAVKNYRFEADIKDNELSFTYQLREGVARNMNACFLMKKMGITV